MGATPYFRKVSTRPWVTLVAAQGTGVSFSEKSLSAASATSLSSSGVSFSPVAMSRWVLILQ